MNNVFFYSILLYVTTAVLIIASSLGAPTWAQFLAGGAVSVPTIWWRFKKDGLI